MSPTVSIIMPCHNAAEHLPTSVGSVLAQTFGDWELIAVNDGSSDDTLAWLQAQTDARIRPHTQANLGVSAARNAGLAEARGTYVAFLDADDTWAPTFLEKMVAALQSRPDTVLAYCGWQNLGLPGGRGEPFVPPDYENAAKNETLFAGCRWPIHAALVRRDTVLAANGFDPVLKNAEDYALWLRVATSAPIVRVPEVLAFYHFHGGAQASSNKARAALHHLHAQQHYLAQHLDFHAALGKSRARELTLGELLKRGYACYWQRDLPAARQIFRAVMKLGYGTLSDWKYMLPAWLPECWHRRLIGLRDRKTQTTDEQP
jgi:glycosyltransferase involved in cell wall biosynthesis